MVPGHIKYGSPIELYMVSIPRYPDSYNHRAQHVTKDEILRVACYRSCIQVLVGLQAILTVAHLSLDNVFGRVLDIVYLDP